MSNDGILLAQYVQTQDAEAFAQLVERYAAVVHTTCRRVCRNAADADDATQETFTELARSAHRITVSLPAWLHCVATRRAWRALERRPRHSLETIAEPLDADAMERIRLSEHVDQAIEMLPERLRELVVLRYLEGLTQQSIALRLGLDQATVSRQLERAIEQLRTRLGASLPALMAVVAPVAAVPPHVLVSLRRIAITSQRPSPVSWRLLPAGSAAFLSAMLASGLVFYGWQSNPLVTGTVLANTHGVSPAALRFDPAGTSATPSTALLERLVTRTQRQVTMVQVGWTLQQIIEPELGESLSVMPGELRPESAVGVDILADRLPLHQLLDQIAKQSGWRWRCQGSRILLDFPLPETQRRQWGDQLRAAVARLDTDGVRRWATSIAASLDADANADLLRCLADPHLNDGSAAARAVQGALIAAIAGNPPTIMRSMNDQMPWCQFATDGECRAGFTAAWQRCVDGRCPFTPILIVLAGILEVSDTVPELHRLLEAPERLAYDLDPHGPLQALVLDNLRRYAIWSLGRLHDRSAEAMIIAQLQQPLQSDVIPALDALGALGDSSAADAVIALNAGNASPVQAAQYEALARLAPERLDELLPPRRQLPSKSIGLPIPNGWLESGYVALPRPEILQRLLSAPSGPQDEMMAWVIMQSLQRAPRLQMLAALQAQPQDPAPLALRKLRYRAIVGDPAALEQVTGSFMGQLPVPLSTAQHEVLLELYPYLAPARVASIVAILHGQLQAVGDGLIIMDGQPEQLNSFLSSHASTTADRTALINVFALSAHPATTRMMLEFLEHTPDQVLPVLSYAVNMNPMLCAAVVRLLKAPSAKTRQLAAIVLAQSFDGLDRDNAGHLLSYLEAVPPADVDPILPKSLRPAHGDHMLPEEVVMREARVQIRWLRLSPRAPVRTAAAFWLAIHMLDDLRPIREEIIAAQLERLAVETDAEVLGNVRMGLTLLLGLSNAPSEYEEINVHLALAGLQDDHVAVKTIDALRPRLNAALMIKPTSRPRQQAPGF